jgi:hypothetical protein
MPKGSPDRMGDIGTGDCKCHNRVRPPLNAGNGASRG